MKAVWQAFRELTRYPSAVLGLGIILGLVGVAVYAMFTIPYAEAIRLWRGGEEIWGDYPKTAPPIWTNWLTGRNLPGTLVLNSLDGTAAKQVAQVTDELNEANLEFTFDYDYDGFPRELTLFTRAVYTDKQPFLSLTWLTPDGREVRVADFSSRPSDAYRFALDEKLLRRLGGLPPEQGLFVDPELEQPVLIRGAYTLKVSALLFEPGSDLDARLVLYGQVHGLAGTDHLRRDLMVPLLWGTPVALAFGLLAAAMTTFMTMGIAAVGVWFGGWVDALIQRISEIRLILPLLSLLIMVGTFYSRSIWLMLGIVIVLNVFGGGIKAWRAIFLQVKEAPFIEAARAYGAGPARIIIRYMIPRVLPLVVPSLVTDVPAFVFLEASLAVLGLGDPVLPTWGKVVQDASQNGALFNGQYYWILEPSLLLMLAGLGFAMVGFALDRIFNPRLRGL